MDENTRNLLKIAVVGPESTGKSTMAKFLAHEFAAIHVPEYARYYCKDLNNSYTLQDELNMFHGQLALEDAIIDNFQAHNIFFFDTTILTVKIWSDHLFDHTPQNVLSEIETRKYDYYLLMNIDLPWEDDPLRDFPKEREHFFKIWQQELEAINANYTIISSLGQDRLIEGKDKCISFINKNTDL